jgi:tetratricopeptide (TPR) repeat protein
MSDRLWNSKASGAYGLFALAWIVYIWGLAPTISWRDSPEFVTIVHTLGISHPAGSPAYALLAKSLTFVPIGNIALRVNLFSALLGALTVALLFSLLYDMLEGSSRPAQFCASMSGALFLLVSESFWRFAEVAEVYTLQNFFIVLLITILWKARACRPATRMGLYWLFAFLYGLSAGVHATMALFVPAFFTFIVLTEPRVFGVKGLAFLAFFFLLGFAVYLYLPVRSLSDPAFDWGDPQTWRQFLIHITDRKDAATHLAFSWWKLPYQARVYMANLSNEFSTLGLVLGMLGCIALLLRDKSLGLLCSLVFLGNVAFFIQSWTVAFGFLPSFVIFSLWIGCGVHTCFHLLTVIYQHHAPRIPCVVVHAVLLGGLLIAPCQTFVRHVSAAHQGGDYSAALYGKHLLEQLPPDALLFSHYSWFPLSYLQHIEKQRPDVTVILQGDILFPRHFAVLSPKRFPNIHLITSPEPVAMSTVDYFWLLCKLNEKDHPLFWDADEKYQRILLEEHLLPRGLLFELSPSNKVEITQAALQDHWKLLSQATDRILQGTPDKEGAAFLASKINLIGIHFKRKGLDVEAARMYQAGLHIMSGDPDLHNNYGNLLISQGHLAAALNHLNAAYSEDPISPIINKNLGRLLLRWGDDAQAAAFFERALVFGGPDGDVYAQLGEAYTQLGHVPKAVDAFQSALHLFTERSTRKGLDAYLQAKIEWVQEQLRRFGAFVDGNGVLQQLDKKGFDCVRGEDDCRRGAGL